MFRRHHHLYWPNQETHWTKLQLLALHSHHLLMEPFLVFRRLVFLHHHRLRK
jgi:hypothetical protein